MGWGGVGLREGWGGPWGALGGPWGALGRGSGGGEGVGGVALANGPIAYSGYSAYFGDPLSI